jgi:hypothetical protein
MIEIKEGGYYRNIQKNVFGPMRKSDFNNVVWYHDNLTYGYDVGENQVYWRADGTYAGGPNEYFDLVCEVHVTDVVVPKKKSLPTQAPASVRARKTK